MLMPQDMILEMLVAKNAFVPGAFTLASGRTTDLKFEIGQVERDPTLLGVLVMGLIDRLDNPGIVDTVVGVATGGTLMARLARPYCAHVTMRDAGSIREIETHKLCGGGFGVASKDMFALRGARVVLFEDTITTGGSVRKAKQVLEVFGADVYAVCTLLKRGSVSARDLGVCELIALVETDFEMTPVRKILGA